MIELINFLDAPYEQQFATLKWRNSDCVAKYFQVKNINEETHKSWLKKLTEESPKTIAFFIRLEGKDIGVAYFHSIDYKAKSADWGIYIYDENIRGKGIGQQTLAQCLNYAKDNLMLEKIYLEVLEDNEIAKKVYEKLGFIIISKIKSNVCRYEKSI